jgi:hypothetical protein
MSDWTPPGYIDVTALVRQHGIDRVRNDLFSGRLQAYQWDGAAPAFYPIEPRLWCADGAARWLAEGWWPPNQPECPPRKVIVRVEDKPTPPPAANGGYSSPFMQLMCEAIHHFNISEQRWPKKDEMERYFCAQKLPDGTPISRNQARYLASFCRPLAAMSGGNKGG